MVVPAAARSDPTDVEARALRLSAGAGLALSVLGVAWGLLARSQVILFDGIYAALLAPYVDPVLVLVAATLILPTPIRMLRTSFRELLEGAPDAEVTEPIHQAVATMRAERGRPEPQCRIGKLGRKVYIELDFVVDPGDGWAVSDADAVRRRLIEALRRPGRLRWLNVELHTHPCWDA